MKISTHLMFEHSAEKAMNFYVALIPDSEVHESQCYQDGELKGRLQMGRFSLAGREFICIDSPVPQDFDFTPSVSIFVDCEFPSQIDDLFEGLSENGNILMPLDNYGFSSRFGWLTDRFGVSWQLNLPG